MRTQVKFSANPIRRVVTLLQNMQKKVEDEGEKSKELFEKFQCYCKTNQGSLGGSIEDADTKIPQLESDIKGSSEAEAQLTAELAGHKSDRAEAQATVAKSTAIREKEAKAFAAESAEQKTNIASLAKAIPAIEKGMGGAFVQSDTAAQLRVMMSNFEGTSSELLSDADRDTLTSFLSGSQSDSQGDDEQGQGAGTGEILGIMKQLKDEMEKDLAAMTETEQGAIAEFNQLISAKDKEIAAATKAIEDKTKRIGDVSVELANLKEDLDDTLKGKEEDKKVLAELTKTCDTKTKEYEAESKTRQEELLAITDTIKMLNDDEALDLFKKTLPGAASAFVEVAETATELRKQALQSLRHSKRRSNWRDYRLNFLCLAMEGKKVGFDKVLTMIDDMITLLGKEQVDDDKKKEYCEVEFDKADDEIKALQGTIDDLGAAINEQKESVDTVKAEVKKLSDAIVELDRSVAEATAQRKEEHEEYTAILASNNAAIQLIEMAKNRMSKFYGIQVKNGPVRHRRMQMVQGPGFLEQDGLSFAQVQLRQERGPGAGEEATGVMAMMDMLKRDVEKEVQEMTFTEKDSQADYEEMVTGAQEKRMTDSQAMEEKQAVLAGLEEEIHKLNVEKESRSEELMDTKQMLAELHEDCDFLIQNYETRKEARTNEIDAMKKAKAILNGADFSLIQAREQHHLRKGKA